MRRTSACTYKVSFLERNLLNLRVSLGSYVEMEAHRKDTSLWNNLTHCVSVNKLNRDVAVGGGKNIQDDLSWQVLLPYKIN